MAKLTPQAKEATVFELWIKDLNGAYDLLESDLFSNIQRMRALGISDKEIFARLDASLNNGLDMFQTFKGKIEGSTDTLLGTTAQIEANTMDDPKMECVWTLDPMAKEHCDDCVRNSESGPKTWDEWESLGLPGAGTTECGDYCKCSLDPA